MKAHWQELSTAGRALVAVIGARLVFGLYLALNDHFSYHDTTSAVTVLAIYGFLAAFTLMFLYGKRSGLWLLLALSLLLIILRHYLTSIRRPVSIVCCDCRRTK